MQELAVIEHTGTGVVNFEEYAMSKQGVLKQVQIIQEVMKEIMHLDEHYGTIPGTNKPSLYKPGAEKLSLTFRLRPEYDIRRADMSNGHREYEVVCTLYHIPTGQSVGQGVGSATTMEGKYRYRTGPVEFTGKPVPKEYWNDRDAKLIGGKGFIAKKNPDTGQWEIAIRGEMVEHENPADYYNTVLKMAKKRAHVDAILTATAASDIFTQDVEDMPEVIPGAASANGTQQQKAPLKEPQKKQAVKKEKPEIAGTAENVLISKATSKEGTSNGKPYTIYTIIDEHGEKYGTFDVAHFRAASFAHDNFLPATIKYSDGKYGKRVEEITVPDMEQGQE